MWNWRGGGTALPFSARTKAAPLAAQLGLPFCDTNSEGIPYPSSWLLWKAFCQFDAGWMIGVRCAFEWDVRVMLLRLPPLVRELKIDGLLIDQNFTGGGTAAAVAGVPFVTICSALLWHEEPGVPPPFTQWAFREGLPARLRPIASVSLPGIGTCGRS